MPNEIDENRKEYLEKFVKEVNPESVFAEEKRKKELRERLDKYSDGYKRFNIRITDNERKFYKHLAEENHTNINRFVRESIMRYYNKVDKYKVDKMFKKEKDEL